MVSFIQILSSLLYRAILKKRTRLMSFKQPKTSKSIEIICISIIFLISNYGLFYFVLFNKNLEKEGRFATPFKYKHPPINSNEITFGKTIFDLFTLIMSCPSIYCCRRMSFIYTTLYIYKLLDLICLASRF